MAKKICVQCRTENAEHYRFCKNCGASLPVVDQINPGAFEYKRTEHYSRPSGQPETYQYDGVSGEELATYIGTNSEKIMSKFFSMQLVGKKTSWCWPVFLFGILFGFFGMAFWFISRKMFKIAAVLAALGVAFIVADAAVNLDVERTLVKEYTSIMSSAYEAGYNADEGVDPKEEFNKLQQQLEAAVTRYNSAYNPIISGISNYIGSMFLPIFFGIYAMYMYKTKAIKDIKRIKGKYPEDEYLMARISAAGGRKGYLVLIPIALMLLCGIVNLILLFI